MRLVVVLIIALLLVAGEPRRRRMGGRVNSGRGISIIGNGVASLVRTIKDGSSP
jgi:hypothetical protein